MVYFRQSCLILFDKRVEIKLDLKPEEKSFFHDFVVCLGDEFSIQSKEDGYKCRCNDGKRLKKKDLRFWDGLISD